MTKSDLIELLCEKQKLPKGRAEALVNTIFECMEESLKRGERIEIRGFGSFEIRSYKAYEGRNPRTGSSVAVNPKRLPFFKVGKELKDRVNEGRGDTAAKGNGASAKPNGAHAGNGAAKPAPVATASAQPPVSASSQPPGASTAAETAPTTQADAPDPKG